MNREHFHNFKKEKGTNLIAFRFLSYFSVIIWEILYLICFLAWYVLCRYVLKDICFVLICFVWTGFVLICIVWICFVLICFVWICFVLICFVLICFDMFCLDIFRLNMFCFDMYCLNMFCMCSYVQLIVKTALILHSTIHIYG